MILGFAGTFAAGKDIGAEYLIEQHNLLHGSTSNMVRVVAKKKYGNIQRKTLHKTADQLRKERGAGALVEVALETYRDQQEEYNGLAVTGIRSLGEARALLAAGGRLIFVDAPREVRFKRSQKRQREGDEPTLEEFIKQEESELYGDGDDEAVINILGVKELADRVIINDDSIGQYFADLENYVNSLA